MRQLTVASWNIHGGIGTDRRCDLGRVLDVITTFDADILALQEVDGRSQFGRQKNAFERLTAALGGHIVEARTIRRQDRDYGHLLWSRWPLEETSVHTLPGGGLEMRATIEARVMTPGAPLRVFATHFGLMAGARRRQAAFLAALARTSREPVLILGDFNEWRRRGPVHAALSAVLPECAAPLTWPARRPRVPLDRLYGSTGLDLEIVADDGRMSAAAMASDHRPVLAHLRVG
ncbi:endonuclease/exonuclease/phosphatase family protein [Mangrovicella endophytica]|uniref:endonuclease/exonuclease/phosphatase family protein n=1 Tax=Mangrovicella endophytica TaxID=2066697 RepID=UPI000C9DD6A7|nr:endonuclease/exonuclease/phosphatase family protein [Mangrovicella endophytica]